MREVTTTASPSVFSLVAHVPETKQEQLRDLLRSIGILLQE